MTGTKGIKNDISTEDLKKIVNSRKTIKKETNLKSISLIGSNVKETITERKFYENENKALTENEIDLIIQSKQNNYVRNCNSERFVLRSPINISFEKFMLLLRLEWSDNYLKTRKKKGTLIYDDNNRFLIDNLYKWLIFDPTYEKEPGKKGNLQAGILVGGIGGVGKTLLMEAFVNMHQTLFKKKVEKIYSDDFDIKVTKKTFKNFGSIPIFMDDIGREVKDVKDWGNSIQPMVLLIDHIYKNPSLIFGTTNFPLSQKETEKNKNFGTIEKFYGTFISERMVEMFNIMVYRGTSKREKYE